MRKLFVAALVVLSTLSSCATAPREIRNGCAIFEQRDGLFNNWRRAADNASHEYGVPVAVLMATIYVESSFRPYARPPRTYILGFIPWKRASTAYGYAQALDGTWERYQSATGRWAARRTSFPDAVKFIAWYHAQSHAQNGIATNDTYNLYMAYYVGHEGYSRGSWRGNGDLQRTARRAAGMASLYYTQLRSCS